MAKIEETVTQVFTKSTAQPVELIPQTYDSTNANHSDFSSAGVDIKVVRVDSEGNVSYLDFANVVPPITFNPTVTQFADGITTITFDPNEIGNEMCQVRYTYTYCTAGSCAASAASQNAQQGGQPNLPVPPAIQNNPQGPSAKTSQNCPREKKDIGNIPYNLVEKEGFLKAFQGELDLNAGARVKDFDDPPQAGKGLKLKAEDINTGKR